VEVLRRIVSIIIVGMLIVPVLLVLCSQVLAAVEVDVEASVYKVVDGDTFDAFPVGRVRLADINAPELDQPGGVEAKSALTSLILNKTVYLDVDDIYVMDRYNRLVCVTYVRYNLTHLLNVNKWLLENNYAVVSDYYNEFDPASWALYVYYPELEEKIVPIIFPAPPPLPEPNYTWVTTNETFYYVMYEGFNCSAGIVFGLCVPQNIELDRNYTIYIYVTRVLESTNITLPQIPLCIDLCIGIGWKCLYSKYLHIGIGLFCRWDRWMWHIPLSFPCSLTLSVSYPNITYPSILNVPLGRWDGPYKAQFTIMGGYTQIKVVQVAFEGLWNIGIFSNSEISGFRFIPEEKSISFNASGAWGTEGFCNITIPRALLDGPWNVYVDTKQIPYIEVKNSTHSSIYITYSHSIRKIKIEGTHIIPEYPLTAMTFIIVSLLTVVLSFIKRKLHIPFIH
jgi:endonuclease YncB( thermonuclease family)